MNNMVIKWISAIAIIFGMGGWVLSASAANGPVKVAQAPGEAPQDPGLTPPPPPPAPDEPAKPAKGHKHGKAKHKGKHKKHKHHANP